MENAKNNSRAESLPGNGAGPASSAAGQRLTLLPITYFFIACVWMLFLSDRLAIWAFHDPGIMSVAEPWKDFLFVSISTAVLFYVNRRQFAAILHSRQSALSALAQREEVLKEVHHRVKNNLQLISSLMGLHSLKADCPDCRRALREAKRRVNSIGLAHEMAYQNDLFAKVNFREYVESLVNGLSAGLGDDGANIQIEIDGPAVFFPLRLAVPCGLMINETVMNALAHAFPGNRAGRVRVAWERADDGFTLEISDNGVGMAVAAGSAKHDATNGPAAHGRMGMAIVRALALQIGGKAEVTAGNGVTWRITFPEKANEQVQGAVAQDGPDAARAA